MTPVITTDFEVIHDPIVILDVDEAYSVSAGDDPEVDTVYFAVANGPGGWYLTAVLDSDSSHFVGDLCTDDGPYTSEHEAKLAGLGASLEWMVTNDHWDTEIDSRLVSIFHCPFDVPPVDDEPDGYLDMSYEGSTDLGGF